MKYSCVYCGCGVDLIPLVGESDINVRDGLMECQGPDACGRRMSMQSSLLAERYDGWCDSREG